MPCLKTVYITEADLVAVDTRRFQASEVLQLYSVEKHEVVQIEKRTFFPDQIAPLFALGSIEMKAG